MDRRKQISSKYTSRNSPPYHATPFCGETKMGNDRMYYFSKSYGTQCRWVKTVRTSHNTKKSKKSPKKTSTKKSPKKVSAAKQSSTKYVTRKSPPYKASAFCGKTKRGNDGKYYVSNSYGNQCRWIKKSPK